MTADEAKEVLRRYRSGTMDPPDPDLTAAQELARTDSALAEWWRAERAWQESARQVLRSVEPPSSLREKLIASGHGKLLRPWQQRIPALAMAASIAFLLSGACWYWWIQAHQQTDQFEIWRGRMARTALREYRMDIVTNNLAAVEAFLATVNGHTNLAIPPATSALPVVGGSSVRFRNQPVSLICFDRGRGALLWLFATDLRTLPEAPTTRRFEQIENLATLTWTAGDKVMLLAVEGDERLLRGFL